jgi:serine protease Do
VPMAPRPGEGGFVFLSTTSDWFGGAELRRLNHDLADLTGADEGVFVVSVAAGSPSDAAGLKGGDVIVRANDANITQPIELLRALRESGDEKSVLLTVVRKKKRQQLTVKFNKK